MGDRAGSDGMSSMGDRAGSDGASSDGEGSPTKRQRCDEVLTASVQLAVPPSEDGAPRFSPVGLVDHDPIKQVRFVNAVGEDQPAHNDDEAAAQLPWEDALESDIHIPADLLAEARREEVAYMRAQRVFEVVPRSAARGCRIVSGKWVDRNKGTAEAPDIRSRYVARDFKGATPAAWRGPSRLCPRWRRSS